MIKIIFSDGKTAQFDTPVNMFQIAKSIVDNYTAKNAVAAKVNNKIVDMITTVKENATVEFIMPNSEEGIDIIRHSTAHLMAHAVINLFPKTKVAIGPSIKNGFYYDFDPVEQFTDEDLIKIQNEMKKLVKKDIKINREEITREDAIKKFKSMGENYKVEIINDIATGDLTLYSQGSFKDLCLGPHVPSTRYLKSFKLMSVAGAYWRGDSSNKMLQRIYGIAFDSDDSLNMHLKFLEEAEKRDHRKLGRELELFFLDEYGPGFPFWLPNGVKILNILENLWKTEHKKAGYKEIKTPIMLNKELWETSGHWFNFRENMYLSEIDKHEFAIKPMNCPGSLLIYKHGLHSYKDLPIRMGELGIVHRHEFSGALHGLFRVRSFTQDDAHIFMLPSQIQDEIVGVIKLIDKFYSKLFGFTYHIELSTKPEKAIGDDKVWEEAETALENAIKSMGIDYKLNPGDGAFYGPKLDFKIKDGLGREWQCGTIQLDFNLPERFDINYIGEDSEKHRPVMIHRVIFGSLERFLGILIEHYAGAFPIWLAPIQLKILTLNSDVVPYAEKIMSRLNEVGIRVELDDRGEKIGYKIREANGKYKIPIQLIIGRSESETESVNIRRFGSDKQETITLDEFIKLIKEESKIKFKS